MRCQRTGAVGYVCEPDQLSGMPLTVDQVRPAVGGRLGVPAFRPVSPGVGQALPPTFVSASTTVTAAALPGRYAPKNAGDLDGTVK